MKTSCIKKLALLLALFVPLVLQAQPPPQPCNIVITGDFESQCLLPTDKDSFYVENDDMLIACQGMRVTYTASVNTGGVTVTNWKWNVVGAATWNDNYNGTAFIAKYVDTSLMHPYVYSNPRQAQYIEWEQVLTFPLSDTLVELTATATSGLPVGYSCDDTTVARVSDGVLRLLRVGTATPTATQNGSTYGYYPAAPVTQLLTVHLEGIEGAEPSAFIVYPNPTQGDVYISTTNEPVVEVSLYTTDGRQLPVQLQGNSVPLSQYPAGVYYLQVTTATETCQFKVTKY